MSVIASPVRKCPISLTLNKQSIAAASQVRPIEQSKKIEQLNRQKLVDKCMQGWNEFTEIDGSFANEYRSF